MNIYKLYSTNNNYKTIAYDGTPLMSFLEDFNFDDYESIRKFNYHWENSDKPISDCPFLIGAIPVIRKSAIPKIRPAISSDLALLIDILVDTQCSFTMPQKSQRVSSRICIISNPPALTFC